MTLVPLTVRARAAAAEPVTMPMARLTDGVHTVTATFLAGGWMLRFGPTGRQVRVDRLAEAEAAARRLVASCFGLPATMVRVRITPDRDAVQELRRNTPSRRARLREV